MRRYFFPLVLIFAFTRVVSLYVPPPTYHLIAQGWTNDPDVVFVPDAEGGTFHNFYQANAANNTLPPWSPGGKPVWRHASTRDWAKWVDHGIVANSTGWGTGTVVGVPGGGFARAFPGSGGIGIGTSSDPTLDSFSDFPTPAVAPPAPPQNSLVGDPFLYFEEGSWYMLVNTCVGGTNFSNCVLPRVQLWGAPALPPGGWTHLSDFFIGPAPTGIRPECPRLWRFGGGTAGNATGSTVLLSYSSPLQGRALSFVGRVAPSGIPGGGSILLPNATPGLLDHAPPYLFYAAHFFYQGAFGATPYVHVVGWVQEARPNDGTTPWFNTLSLPRNTSLAPDGSGRLSAAPSHWITALRSPLPLWSGEVFAPGGSQPTPLPPVVGEAGRAVWVEAQLLGWAPCAEVAGARADATPGGVDGGNSSSWELRVLATPPMQGGGVAEYTAVRVSPRAVTVDTSSSSSARPGVGSPSSTAGAAPASTGFVGVSALVDHSILEVFAHSDVRGEAVITARVFPQEPLATGVYIAAVSPPPGAPGACVRVTAYSMPQQ